MSNRSIRVTVWWICLVATPLILAGMQLFHPSGFTNSPGMYEYLCKPQPYDARHVALYYPGPQWWYTLHLIQTPLIGLVSIGMLLLVRRVRDEDGAAAVALAWLARAATFVFLIYYTALDSIGGTGLARSILSAQDLFAAGKLSQTQMDGVALLLNTVWVDPYVGGVGSFISLTGSWAVLIAAFSAAGSLYLARRAPWPALLLLAAFGWMIFTSHAAPYGPIGFLCLTASALWIWWSGGKFEHKRAPRKSRARLRTRVA